MLNEARNGFTVAGALGLVDGRVAGAAGVTAVLGAGAGATCVGAVDAGTTGAGTAGVGTAGAGAVGVVLGTVAGAAGKATGGAIGAGDVGVVLGTVAGVTGGVNGDVTGALSCCPAMRLLENRKRLPTNRNRATNKRRANGGAKRQALRIVSD